MRYLFLEFVLDTEQQTLAGPVGAMPLRRQSFLVLQHLVEHAPSVVSKDEILDAIWGHQSISSSAVAQTIRELRDALNDHAEDPRAIETRHRVGYRFIAPVTKQEANTPTAQEPTVNPPFVEAERPPRTRMASRAAAWVLAVCVVAILAVVLMVRTPPAPTSANSRWPDMSHARTLALAALDASRNHDTSQALQDLGQVQIRDDSPRLDLWLARLHVLRGETRAAGQILALLEARRGQLQRGDQLMLDALQGEVAGRYAAAVDTWRILFEMDPGDVDVGLALFDLQIHERSDGARETFERVSRLGGISVERQLLMSAQLADLEHKVDRQGTQAQAAIAVAGSRWPTLAALARIEIGRVLKSRGKISEARDMFARAVSELEQQGLQRAALELRLDKIDPAIAQGDLDEVAAELGSLQERAEASGDAYSAGRVLHARGRLARRTGDNDQAIALYAAAAQQHESIGNNDGVASALSAQAGPLKRAGRTAEARAALDRALRLAEASGTASVRASIHGNLANLAATEARYADARQHYDAALSLFRELHDKGAEAVTLGNLANVAAYSGDLRTAEKLNRDALALFRELQRPADVARILTDIAVAALEKGDLAEAGQLAEESAGIFGQLGDPRRLAITLCLGADVKIHAAELEAAEALLDASGPLEKLELEAQAIIATLRGRIALLRDQRPKARKNFEFALKQRVATGDRTMQRVSQLDIAGLELIEGHLVEAEQAALAIIVQSREDHQPSGERSARILLAEILLQQKRFDDAEREMVAARQMLDATPQFDDEAAWTLLRARLDPSPKRIDRLEWLVEHARKHEQHLLELRATGALYAETSDPKFAQWREQVRLLGLLALLRSRLILSS